MIQSTTVIGKNEDGSDNNQNVHVPASCLVEGRRTNFISSYYDYSHGLSIPDYSTASATGGRVFSFPVFLF